MRMTYTQEIAAPIDRVFDLIQDPDKHKLWLKGVEETRYVEPYDPANPVGTKFKQSIREGGRVKVYDGEVTAFARPKHLGIRLFSPQFSVAVDYRLTPVAGGTRLDYGADFTSGSWFIRFLGRVLGFFTRGILRKQMHRLKAMAEDGSVR
jgi:uncharacterized protein YndB with AHSA1/START domain